MLLDVLSGVFGLGLGLGLGLGVMGAVMDIVIIGSSITLLTEITGTGNNSGTTGSTGSAGGTILISTSEVLATQTLLTHHQYQYQ